MPKHLVVENDTEESREEWIARQLANAPERSEEAKRRTALRLTAASRISPPASTQP